MPSLALFQPEIAANLGAAIRIAACFDAPLSVIEPCGFPWRERDIRKAALDYETELRRFTSWAAFEKTIAGRLVLMTTKGARPHPEVDFKPDDIILLGQESAGVPQHVHERADIRARIPMSPAARSLNVTVAGAIALAEAARQLGQFS